MDPFATSHFSDDALLHDARRLVGQGFMSDAMLLTRITEIDRRQLYRREGYPSMYAYIIEEWHLTEDAAYKRIHAARAAQRFPAVLIALAEGRLHMRAVLMLAPHLTAANVDELVAAATHRSRFEIQQLLAGRFPQPDLPERLQPLVPPLPVTTTLQPSRGTGDQLAPEQVHVTISEQPAHEQADAPSGEPARAQAPMRTHPLVPAPAHEHSPENVEPRPARPVLKPLAPERFAFQCTFDRETHDLLQDVRALMSHEVPTGEIAVVLKGALKLAKAQLEKRKFASTDRPGRSRGCASARRIPAAVKRTVWERDGGQCAFVSESGRRCPERTRLEYDHAEPVAQGGQATAENVRLLCRSHNQYAAERAFGIEFMERKRAEADRTR